jgi:guanylate kinase
VMNSIKRGKIIVIVAPSGTGKSTLIKRLRKDFPNLKESVSFTTRKKREGEVHGENYFYTDVITFKNMIDRGEFIEWAIVHSNYYGTSKKVIENELLEGTDLLFDLDVQGADFFKNYFKDEANIIFLEPPSLLELENRLMNRGTESLDVIKERISNAAKELKRKNDFDYLVLNKVLDQAYEDLKEIFNDILNDQ